MGVDGVNLTKKSRYQLLSSGAAWLLGDHGLCLVHQCLKLAILGRVVGGSTALAATASSSSIRPGTIVRRRLGFGSRGRRVHAAAHRVLVVGCWGGRCGNRRGGSGGGRRSHRPAAAAAAAVFPLAMATLPSFVRTTMTTTTSNSCSSVLAHIGCSGVTRLSCIRTVSPPGRRHEPGGTVPPSRGPRKDVRRKLL